MKRGWILLTFAAACTRPAADPPAPQGRPADAGPVLEVRTPEADVLLRVARLEVEPPALELAVGQVVPLRVSAYDRQGRRIPDVPLRITGGDGIVSVEGDRVRGVRPGTGTVVVEAPAPAGVAVPPVVVEVPVRVTDPPVERARNEAPVSWLAWTARS